MRSSTFDQIDQQILDLLIENSRISLIDISEQVGLSRVAVKTGSTHWKRAASSNSTPSS